MDKATRKQIQRDYVERKRSMGVFAVRCAATGQAWVGATRNLENRQNGLWFTFKAGGAPDKALQAAWDAHGEAAFSYEPLEEIPLDNPHAIGDLLTERAAQWREQLDAGELPGTA
ncbi:MAG: GIY-YIG nuclease family protein [Alphaproteobacteria bacterium]|nr:GIY-YIG nuclease family protein [Alphaproteobacteria bacterium]